MVTELTNGEFDDFIKEGLVLIDFFADWCMPCMMMGPILEEVSAKFEGKIKFGKVDVGEYQDIAQKFNVSSIPNFTLLKNGTILDQFTGSMSEEDFEEKLNSHLR
ncbi:thioredoxin [archaeon]|jgi:thioredoxin 1|nr:thioredoxin [archaeon]